MFVSSVENGAWIKIKGVDFGEQGAKKFIASIAAGADGGSVTLRLDSEVGLPLGTIKVKSTGGLAQFETQSCTISGARGVRDLYIKFFGENNQLVNMDWWKFEQ